MQDPTQEIYEDVWIPTQCGGCYARCAIKVHRINGVVVKIEGNPDSWFGAQGGLCGKGEAYLQLLYDPNRLNVPLRRTNPEKGLFSDPKWKEISWEEALEEIAEKLNKILKDDPRKLMLQATTQLGGNNALGFRNALMATLGTPNWWVGGGGIHCGNGAHQAAGMIHASWSMVPDYKYCNYAILFGASKGHGAGHSAAMVTRLAAQARARGMKLVVFDPMCNFAGGKATEWIPILPGTDAAVVLAMCNIMLNELGAMDHIYLKTKTNGSYLVGPDGKYIRDSEAQKPLIWDTIDRKAKVYDDPTVKDYSLEGIYKVYETECQPAFELIRQHVKQYTPEFASQVSTVPANIIRRITLEFAEEARIGSTIRIEGKDLPYRPVSAVIFRGGEGHTNSLHTCFAVSLLNQIVGAADVPGGTLGWPARCVGSPESNRLKWSPVKGPDGCLTVERWNSTHAPWPIVQPRNPISAGLHDLFTLCTISPIYGAADQEELWQKLKLPYRIEMLINYGCNSVISTANPDLIAESLKKIPFIVQFDLFSNEFAEGFTDILLPDTCYLETLTWKDGETFWFNYPVGMEPWCFHISQPVVKPQYQRRFCIDVCWELVDRVGKRAELNEYWNRYYAFDEANKLKPTEQITWEQLGDKVLKYWFGIEHDLDWFRQHGFISWDKQVEEAYWRHFLDIRIPIYLEFLIDQGRKVKEITEEVGISLDWKQYTPLVDWFPCPPNTVVDPQYDLYCFSYRDILHTGSTSMEIPWLDEASLMNPYTYNITMNPDTARKNGLKDRDEMEIESVHGRKIKGILKTMQGQHPQTVAIAACSGHWARGLPIAKGKGTNFDILLELDLKHMDPVCLNIETCVRVKVRKANHVRPRKGAN